MSRSKPEGDRRGTSGRRRRRSASEWRRLIDQHCRSGQTVKAFCAKHDVSQASFYSWRRHLGGQPTPPEGEASRPDRSPPPGSAGFVRLEPEGEASGEAIEVRFACGATLRCSSSQLPELVRSLKGEADGDESC